MRFQKPCCMIPILIMTAIFSLCLPTSAADCPNLQ
nr:MAG TPA: hypothetical protein [Caudoviricetes sp.]